MKVGLVFLISNFFINKIALANTRMSFSCSNLALAEQSQKIHSKWCHAGWKKLSFWVKIVVFLWVTQLVTTIVFFSQLSRDPTNNLRILDIMQTTLDYLSSHFMPFLLNYWLTTQHPVIRLPVFFMGICAGILCTRSKQGDFDAFQSKANFFLNSYFYGVLKSDTQYNMSLCLYLLCFFWLWMIPNWS